MAHRSGGGSHGGGRHGGSHHGGGSHGGGSRGPRYSKTPFPNSRKFRYYDRHGRENFIYCSSVPRKISIFTLIFNLIFFIPFIFAGLFVLVFFLVTFLPPKPLIPVYETTDVHIVDEIGVIDNKDILENTMQAFEDLTGVSPFVMTVYDSEWVGHFDDFSDYAYAMYLNTFSDEQHFLIMYSEPENAEELDFVDWSWEAIQGDETDKILTESHFGKFSNELHDDLLRTNVSVGEAFENAFRNSLTYMMEGDRGESLPIGIFVLLWNFFIGISIFSIINNFIKGRRDYQEVPLDGNVNAVPGTMGYGNNNSYIGNAGNQNNIPYQNNTIFQGDGYYQSNINYNGSGSYQNNLNGAQYNGNLPYNNTGQYNTGQNNIGQYNTAQYNPESGSNDNYYNDDARFRSADYYDDDARYRGSTAYESGKKQ